MLTTHCRGTNEEAYTAQPEVTAVDRNVIEGREVGGHLYEVMVCTVTIGITADV